MAKTKEELTQLKAEYMALKEKLVGLSDEELKQVAGGANQEDAQMMSANGNDPKEAQRSENCSEFL